MKEQKRRTAGKERPPRENVLPRVADIGVGVVGEFDEVNLMPFLAELATNHLSLVETYTFARTTPSSSILDLFVCCLNTIEASRSFSTYDLSTVARCWDGRYQPRLRSRVAHETSMSWLRIGDETAMRPPRAEHGLMSYSWVSFVKEGTYDELMRGLQRADEWFKCS